VFSIKLTGNVQTKLQLAIDNVGHLDEALKQFSKYLRNKTKEKFAQEGPGWPGLAQSTDKRLTHSFAGQFSAHGTLKKSAKERMRGMLAAKIKKGKIPQGMLAKFDAAVAGKLSGPGTNTALALLGYTKRSKLNAAEKLQVKLQKLSDMTHAERSAKLGKNRNIKKHKMLGKLASSINSTIKGSTLTVYSKVPWAGVHNDGGTAGHGARIPERTFLTLEDADLEVLAELVEGQVIENF
jgi:phage gpG-like protein